MLHFARFGRSEVKKEIPLSLVINRIPYKRMAQRRNSKARSSRVDSAAKANTALRESRVRLG
jgi:hypothetical protein